MMGFALVSLRRAYPPFRNHTGLALETRRSPSASNEADGPREIPAKLPSLTAGRRALVFA